MKLQLRILAIALVQQQTTLAFAPFPSTASRNHQQRTLTSTLPRRLQPSLLATNNKESNQDAVNNYSDKDNKPTWKMFFDLQCPYSRKLWGKVPALKEHFGQDFEISLHTTALAFHRQSFPAQTAAFVIGKYKGSEIREQYQNALYDNFDKYSDDATETMTKTDLNGVFADIAQPFFDETFSRDVFLEKIRDRKEVIMPTWFEHKEALVFGVFKAPQHVIEGHLVPDTESSWEIADYEEALKKLREEGVL